MNNMAAASKDLTLRDYVRVLFRQRAVIAITVVAVTAVSFVALSLKTRMFEASVKMLISAEKQVQAPYYKEAVSARAEQTLTQSEIVTSDAVLSRVVSAQLLDRRPLDDEKEFAGPLKDKLIELKARFFNNRLSAMGPEERAAYLFRLAKENLKNAIHVEPVRDTNIFTITVRDYNPIAAAIIANTVSRSYVIYDLEQQLAELSIKYGDKHPKVKNVRDNIAAMEKTLDGQPLVNIDAIGPASVKIIEQSSVPLTPSGRSKALIFLLSIGMSVFLALTLAFVFEYADQTLKNPGDIEAGAGIPCVGSVRRRGWFQKPLIDFTKKSKSLYGRSNQVMLEHLYLTLKDKGASSLMVAPMGSPEEAAVFVANTANYLAEVWGKRVLVVNADLRARLKQNVFKVSGKPGLADYLEEREGLENIARKVTDNLCVVPAGEASLDVFALFESGAVTRLVEEAKAFFDFIIVQSPATRGHKDWAMIAKAVDAVLLTVEEGRVRRQVARAVSPQLKDKARRLLGAVLLNRTYLIPKWIYERV